MRDLLVRLCAKNKAAILILDVVLALQLVDQAGGGVDWADVDSWSNHIVEGK